MSVKRFEKCKNMFQENAEEMCLRNLIKFLLKESHKKFCPKKRSEMVQTMSQDMSRETKKQLENQCWKKCEQKCVFFAKNNILSEMSLDMLKTCLTKC